MAESVQEQLVSAFQTLLEATTGWYPPSVVQRAPGFTDECLDIGQTTIYTVVPNRVEATPLNSLLGIDAHLLVDLVLATRMDRDLEPGGSAPLRWTVQNRLEQDAKAQIATNYRLLGAADGHLFTTVPVTDYAPELTYDQVWAIVYLRVDLRYTYPDRTP